MKKLPAMSDFFVNNAEKYGASVLLDDEWGYAGMIKLPNGESRFFKYNHIDINTVGSSEIAKDKDYAGLFLSKLGYKTIEGKTFFSDEWARDIGSDRNIDKAQEYAKEIGFPVFVKPNSSGLGMGVALVEDEKEFKIAFNEALLYDKVVLVQKPHLNLNDYRIVVFNGEFICAYRKEPLTLVGDGKSTIEELFNKKKEDLENAGRNISVFLDDYRIKNSLSKLGYDTNTVIKEGEKIKILQNANMSQGGDGFDVSDSMGEEWKAWAIKIAKEMNLKLCGIDFLTNKDIKGTFDKDTVIIEVNSSPGLGHFATLSNEARETTDNLYKKMLEYMVYGK